MFHFTTYETVQYYEMSNLKICMFQLYNDCSVKLKDISNLGKNVFWVEIETL